MAFITLSFDDSEPFEAPLYLLQPCQKLDEKVAVQRANGIDYFYEEVTQEWQKWKKDDDGYIYEVFEMI